MNSPEYPLGSEILNEKFVIDEVANCIEDIAEEGFTMRPDGHQRESAWARDFYDKLKTTLSARLMEDGTVIEPKHSQHVTVGELAKTQSIMITRYSKNASPNPTSQRGLCITWGYESFGLDQTRLSQTLVQVGSRTEGWEEIPTVNMPLLVAEYKTTQTVVDNSQELGLQREIPGWVKIAGGVAGSVGALTLIAVGTTIVYGKLKNK